MGRSMRAPNLPSALLGLGALAALAACRPGGAAPDAPREATETVPDAPFPEGPHKHPSNVQQFGVEVLAVFDHDPTAFTQGLELRDGVLYESTGLYGESEIRRVEPSTGAILDAQSLPDEHFGEGLTLTEDVVWQLTWKAGVAYRRDPITLEVIDTVAYEGEAWGICYDGTRLVVSDGSATLTFRDPITFEKQGTVAVTSDGGHLAQLNELECAYGRVWANVWLTDHIVRINPANGEVEASVDASGLLTEEESATADVLNGIAVAEEANTFYLTGKLWPHVFLVEFL